MKTPATSALEEPRPVQWLLIGLAMLFAAVCLLLPLLNVFVQALGSGWSAYAQALTHADTKAALRLTVMIAAVSVPANVIFGVCAAWAIAKFQFPGKAVLLTVIDLPFSISPVVSGLLFILLFGAGGFFGAWLQARHIQIIFAWPGMALATAFVTIPYVVGELIPVLQTQGSDQEQAALTLGANGWQTFWHITLPSIRWGLLYGVILCTARAMGEYGAVAVVSSHIAGKTDTVALRVEKLANEYNPAAPFAVASLLALLALVTLGLKCWLEARTDAAEKPMTADH